MKRSVTKAVSENIMNIKNMIIDALKEEHLKLQNKVKKSEEQLLEIDEKSSHLDHYNRRNNLEIQDIPGNVTDDKLEGKVIDIFSCLGIEVKGADTEDCCRSGFANPKNIIVRFVNCKFCYQSLDKKWNCIS